MRTVKHGLIIQITDFAFSGGIVAQSVDSETTEGQLEIVVQMNDVKRFST